jgi:hypothetical protein
MNLYAEISAGELIDKISILEIKSEKIKDENKLEHINMEKDILSKEAQKLHLHQNWLDKIKEVNLKLWRIEDDIREKERKKEFDQVFIELARAVYFTNDERFNVKNQINLFYSSNIVEQKSYEKYN